MTDLNHFDFTGRLVKDSEKETKNGLDILNFCVAVNRNKKTNNDEWAEYTSFFYLQILGKRAAALKKYLKKGTRVAIEAYLEQERWEKAGKSDSKVAIKVTNITLLSFDKSEEKAAETTDAQPVQNEEAEITNSFDIFS